VLVPQVRVLRLDANLGPGQTLRALTERQLEIVHRFSQVAVFGLAEQPAAAGTCSGMTT